jgi:peptidoglycan/xylan/chitin deacetylase (PgdA/CDA1 family)
MNTKAYHFLGFIMHQPKGNLLELLDNEHEAHQAKQILLAYQRAVVYAERYHDVARFCVAFSGILLEQLQDPKLIDRVRDYIDLPHMLERYKNAQNIELAGSGYYHPLFPLIPEAHWRDHILRGRDKITEVFGRQPVVFWPPEMGFSINMIPELVDAGYKYVVCDGIHVRPNESLNDEETIYRGHIAESGNKRIILVPRDGKLSEPQENGTEPDYVRGEVLRKTSQLNRPALITTWSDGENGGWFRVEHDPANYWGRFFAPYMERVRNGKAVLIPTALDEFFSKNPVDSKASVVSGTWKYDPKKPENTSFQHWAGTQKQNDVLDELRKIAEKHAEKTRRAEGNPAAEAGVNFAYELILKAEASDNIWYKNPWLERSWALLNESNRILDEVN